jgi:hypothetical protein
MSQTAAHLVDHVIPHVPVRQWVLSLPIPLRVLLAAQPELVTPVLQVVQRVVTRQLLAAAGLVADEGRGGAVTLIQRFGSAANLNIHLHCLVLDGVYRCDADGVPSFVEAGAPTDEELHALLQTVIARLMKMLTRRGVLVEDMGQTYLAEPDADGEEARTLRPLQAAAITYRIAFGPRAGQKVLTLRGATPRESAARESLCADIDGFSLHAAVRVEANDRKRLEQLCRYITRPALSDERVQLNAAGQVELKLKPPWRDGTTHLVMSPLEFMQRLAALVPRPRLHLIRFHGVLAPNAKLRPVVVPKADSTQMPEGVGSWAAVGGHGQHPAVGGLQPGAGLQPLGLRRLGPAQGAQVGQPLAGLGGVQRQRAGHAAHQRARCGIAFAAGRQQFHQRQPGGGAGRPGRPGRWQQAQLQADVALPGRACNHPQRQPGPGLQGGAPVHLRRAGRGSGQRGPLQAIRGVGQGHGRQGRVVASRGDPLQLPATRGDSHR